LKHAYRMYIYWIKLANSSFRTSGHSNWWAFGLVNLRTDEPSDWWTFGLVGGHLLKSQVGQNLLYFVRIICACQKFLFPSTKCFIKYLTHKLPPIQWKSALSNYRVFPNFHISYDFFNIPNESPNCCQLYALMKWLQI
jgi:hypothetical protein